jgi:DNA-binding transcriptional regulator YdaS (Cro superfamily)
MDHSAIIDTLGGTSAFAKALGCNPGRVSRWRSGGIPPVRYPAVVKLAKRQAQAEITLEALYAGLALIQRRRARLARATA